MPRRSFVQSLPNLVAVPLLLGVVFLSGCSEDGGSTIMEIEPQSTSIVRYDNVLLSGGEWRADYFEITGEMTHPEVRSNWTIQNREIYVDMYLFRASDYDPRLAPSEQSTYFWTSVPSEGPLFGDRRGTQIILHPCVYDTDTPPMCRPQGQWVVVFFNDNQAIDVKRTRFSANVNLRYFQ